VLDFEKKYGRVTGWADVEKAEAGADTGTAAGGAEDEEAYDDGDADGDETRDGADDEEASGDGGAEDGPGAEYEEALAGDADEDLSAGDDDAGNEDEDQDEDEHEHEDVDEEASGSNDDADAQAESDDQADAEPEQPVAKRGKAGAPAGPQAAALPAKGSTSGRYVPPHERKAAAAAAIAGAKPAARGAAGDKVEPVPPELLRKVKGLVNRISPANVDVLAREVGALYGFHSRAGGSCARGTRSSPDAGLRSCRRCAQRGCDVCHLQRDPGAGLTGTRLRCPGGGSPLHGRRARW
jgi:hypothetical protein